MFSSIGKTPAFLMLFVWLTICSPVVSAQDKTTKQIFPAEAPSDISERKTKTKIQPISDSKDNEANIFQEKDIAETIKRENFQSSAVNETKIDDFAYHFRPVATRQRQLNFQDVSNDAKKQSSFRPRAARADLPDDTKKIVPPDDTINNQDEKFQWRQAIGQSLMFIAVQHGYALTQPKTREAIKGKFWKDYTESFKSLHGWADGGRFFTNYIAHPMQGSLTGFIYVQNSPKERRLQFAESGAYWTSRLKAMAWTAAWSTQFEIGPVSQASIGNVGLKGKQTYIDLVVTPTVGTAMLIAEDAVDRVIIKRIERYSDNFYMKIFSRMLLNPTRNFSNLLRFKAPWHRDRPPSR